MANISPSDVSNTYNPGAIKLDFMRLRNYKGTIIDVRNICIEFNIYTDLFSQGMSCDLVIADGIGLIEKFPLVGDETLEIMFRTPTFDESQHYLFNVYKISSRISHQHNMETYVLNCCSQEMLKDIKENVNKVYKDMKISDMIPTIYNDFLKPVDGKDFAVVRKKELDIEETKDNFYYVSPGFRPMYLIDALAREAQSSKHKSSSFIFYENETGWHFNTIDELLEQDSKDSFYHAQADFLQTRQDSLPDNKRTIFPYQKIYSIKHLKTFDTMNSASNGLYGNTIDTIDPIRKIFITDAFTYDDDAKDINHLGAGKPYAPDSYFTKDTKTYFTNYVIGDVGNAYQDLEYIKRGKIDDIRIKNTRNYHKFGKYNTAMMTQIDRMTLEIVIPGHSNIFIGDIINIFVPQTDQSKFKSNIFFGDDETSKFLVVGTRQSFNAREPIYRTVIQCVKDTYFREPVEIEDF